MTDYSTALAQLSQATTLDEIKTVVNSFSAAGTGRGGILYSGSVGSVSANTIAVELANTEGLSIINNTARAMFLTDNSSAIMVAIRNIISSQNPDMTAKEILDAATNVMFGDGYIASGKVGSLSYSLWGEASASFISSLSGDITIIASNANSFRIFSGVEIPALLNNESITSIGGIAAADLKVSGVDVFSSIQSQFVHALSLGGIYGEHAAPTAAFLSKELVSGLGLNGTTFDTAAEISAAGFSKLVTTTSVTIATDMLEAVGASAVDVLGSAVGGAILTVLTSASAANAHEDLSHPLIFHTNEKV